MMFEEAVPNAQPINDQNYGVSDKIDFLLETAQYPLAQRAFENQKPINKKNQLYDSLAMSFRKAAVGYFLPACRANWQWRAWGCRVVVHLTCTN